MPTYTFYKEGLINHDGLGKRRLEITKKLDGVDHTPTPHNVSPTTGLSHTVIG
jgi:hypothetical protein